MADNRLSNQHHAIRAASAVQLLAPAGLHKQPLGTEPSQADCDEMMTHVWSAQLCARAASHQIKTAETLKSQVAMLEHRFQQQCGAVKFDLSDAKICQFAKNEILTAVSNICTAAPALERSNRYADACSVL